MRHLPLLFLKNRWLSARCHLVGAGALLVLSSGACNRQAATPPAAARTVVSRQAQARVIQRAIRDPEVGLYFDEAYLDSLDHPPYNERIQRQLAIRIQLTRLRLEVYADEDYKDKKVSLADSIYEGAGDDRPRIGFANRAAHLADIYRKIDSLKVLEHQPLTPWPTDPRYALPPSSTAN